MDYKHEQACFEYGRQQGLADMKQHVLEVLKLWDRPYVLKDDVIKVLEV